MPYTQDYSDYFTITGLPQTITRSISQSLNTSESLSRSVSAWRVIESHSDSVSLSESLATPSVTTYRTTISTSDSFSLSESLARSLDTWEHIHSHSDTLSTAESLVKATTSFRTTISKSDSIATSESLGRAVETWRYILSHSMGLSLSESLGRAINTWRTIESNSDSISTGESLALLVDTYQRVESHSESIAISESLNRAVEYWEVFYTNSDSLSTSDSFSAQIRLDENSYFYDTINLSNATTTVGYINSGLFTSSVGLVSNVNSLVDGQTLTPAVFTASNYAGVRFDLGSAKESDFICVHLQSGAGQGIKLYGSNSQGSNYSLITTATNGNDSWTVNIYVAQSFRYLVLQVESATVSASIDEIIIGNQFTPSVRYDVGSSENYKPLTVTNESYTGVEYSYSHRDASKVFNHKYPNVDLSLRTEFENLNNKSINKKFIYYNDKINYCSLNPISFNEVAYNRYATNVSFLT